MNQDKYVDIKLDGEDDSFTLYIAHLEGKTPLYTKMYRLKKENVIGAINEEIGRIEPSIRKIQYESPLAKVLWYSKKEFDHDRLFIVLGVLVGIDLDELSSV